MASREITDLPELITVALDDYVLVRDITDGLDKKAQVGNLLASRIGGDTGSTDNAILRADGGGGKTLQAATNAIIDDDGQMALGSLSAGAMLDITCRASDVKGQKINAADGQTANLVEITKYGGTAGDLFVVNYKGDVGITVVTGAPDEPLHVQSDYDGNRAIRMQNESNGTAAVSRFIADSSGGSVFFCSYGSGFTSVGSRRAGSGSLIASGNVANGLSIVAKNATGGDIRFYAGGNDDAQERGIIAHDGKWGINVIDPDSQLELAGSVADLTVLHLKAAASQTNPILDVTDSSDTTLFKINPDGSITLPYLGDAPSSLENGMAWMESDGMHIYYNDAEKVVAGA